MQTLDAFELLIANSTKPIRLETLDLRQVINRDDSLVLEVSSEGGVYSPTLGDELSLTEPAFDLFGGFVDEVEERGLGHEGPDDSTNQIQATGFTTVFQRRNITETIAAGTLQAAMTVLIANYFGAYGITMHPSQVAGPMLPELIYDHRRGGEVVAELSKLSGGYISTINTNKEWRMFEPGSEPAGFDVVDGDGHAIGDMEAVRTRVEFYNRIVVQGGTSPSVQLNTDSFVGDGVQDTFPLTSILLPGTYGLGYVTRAGLQEPFGPPAATWTYDVGTNSIVRAAPPFAADTVVVTYQSAPTAALTVTAENAASIASQGLIESPPFVFPGVFDFDRLQTLANELLVDHLSDFLKVTYRTYESGLTPGLAQHLTSATRHVDSDFIISEVHTRNQKDKLVLRTVTAIEGTRLRRTFIDTYEKWEMLGGGGGNLSVIPTASVSGSSVFTLSPMNNERPAADYAIWLKRGRRPVLQFSGTVDTEAVFSGIMSGLGANGIIVRLIVTPRLGAGSSTSQTVRFEVSIERSNTHVDTDSFAAAQSAGHALNATGGPPVVIDVPFTTSQIDGVVGGEMCRIKVRRDADGTTGTDDFADGIDFLMGYVLAQ